MASIPRCTVKLKEVLHTDVHLSSVVNSVDFWYIFYKMDFTHYFLLVTK